MVTKLIQLTLVLALLMLTGCVRPLERLVDARWATALPDDPLAASIPKNRYVPVEVPTFKYLGSDFPGFTSGNGRLADPVNLLIRTAGTDTLGKALAQAGWILADPITVANLQRQALALSHRVTYPAAPVSDLFLFARSQDVGIEKNSDNIDQRDHVRLWGVALENGAMLYLAAATKDSGIKRDPRTGLPTHSIAPNIDDERKVLSDDLTGTGLFRAIGVVPNASSSMKGENMAGDPYYSDGNIAILEEVTK